MQQQQQPASSIEPAEPEIQHAVWRLVHTTSIRVAALSLGISEYAIMRLRNGDPVQRRTRDAAQKFFSGSEK